mmetsp:Transcript_63455/g.185526  ORF Transcript_63455/g.185526 Transcript_63455/m.185526 type:complete len:263 (+) Transcript_63455:144-932(+)
MSSPFRSFPSIIITRADGLFDALMCFSNLSKSPFLSSLLDSTSASLCVAVPSILYFLQSVSTSLSGFGLPTKVPDCISRILTINRPGGTRACSMISHRASKSPSQVSGRLFNSSFSILVIRGSMPKWSQNSWTSGSMDPSEPGAAAPGAGPGVGSAEGCRASKAASAPGIASPAGSAGAGKVPGTGGKEGAGPPGGGGPLLLFMTCSTSCCPMTSLSGGPRMETFLGTPSGNFWSIWMEHPDCSCSFLMVSPPLPITRPTKL